jgi:hypothetical protein
MPIPEYASLPGEKLVEMCSRSAYTLDGLWFTLVEEKFGLEKALEIDIEVWRRLSIAQARRVLKYFHITEEHPVHKLMKVIQLDPLLYVFQPTVVELTEKRAVLRMANCPPQKARIRDGRGEFPCKPVGINMLNAYIEVIDPRIKLTHVICPPDVHPGHFWCEWQFEMP